MQCFSNYRGIKSMSHTVKPMVRVVEPRLRSKVMITKQHYAEKELYRYDCFESIEKV